MNIASLFDDRLPSLNEDEDEMMVNNAVNRMRRRMRQGSYLALKDGIDDLEELGLHDNQIAQALQTAKADVIAWLDKSLGHAYTDRLVNQILMLVDIGLSWPEITRSLDAHKDAVIKGMLQRLSRESADAITLMHLKGYIERFSKMGIRWPELRAIWKSITSVLKDRNLNEDGGLGEAKRKKEPEVDMNLKIFGDVIRNCSRGNLDGAVTDLAWMFPYSDPASLARLDTSELDRYKDGIIKELLLRIRDESHESFFLGQIESAVDALESMGKNWPELAIIRRALDSMGNSINENAMEDKPDWYREALHQLQTGNVYFFLQRNRYTDRRIKEDPRWKALLNSFKWVFVRALDRSVDDEFDGFQETAKMAAQIKALGVDWPELDSFWEDHKTQVMRQLLRTVSGNDEDSGYYAWQEINSLKVAGVKWPELDVVLKSALAVMGEKDRKQMDEDDYDRDRDLGMWQDADDDRGMPDVDVRFHDMLHGSTDVGDLEEILGNLEDMMGASRGEVDELVRDDLDYILSWFEDRIDRTAKQDVVGFLFTMDDLYDISNPTISGKIGAALDSSKDAVIRCLLTSIKSGFGYHRDLETLKRANDLLKRMVSWPELATIGRSLDAKR